MALSALTAGRIDSANSPARRAENIAFLISYPSPYAAVWDVLEDVTLDSNAASRLYAAQLLGGAQYTADGEAHWGDPGDLYAQEWGWFGTALYANALPDIWHQTSTED